MLSLLAMTFSCVQSDNIEEEEELYGELSIPADQFTVDALAQSLVISVTSDSDWKVELLEESPEWIEDFTREGSGIGTVTINFPVNVGYQSNTAYFRISLTDTKGEPIQFEVTQGKIGASLKVADVFETGLRTSVFVENLLVLGVSETGFIACDETGTIAVDIFGHPFVPGDVVSLSGFSAKYHGVIQIDAMSVIKMSSGNALPGIETPELKTDASLVGYMTCDSIEYVSALVDVVSVSSLSGREAFEQTGKAQFDCCDMGAGLQSLVGKSAEVEGYIYGSRSGKAYFYAMSAKEYVEPSYFSVSDSSFSEVSYNGGEMSFSVSANVPWEITCPEGISVDKTSGTSSSTVKITVLKNDEIVKKDFVLKVSTTGAVETPVLNITFSQAASPSRPDPVHLSLNLLRNASTWPFETPKMDQISTSDSSIGTMKGDQTFTMPLAKGGYSFVFHSTDGMKLHTSQGLCFGKQKGDKLDLPAISRLKLVKVIITFGYKNNSMSYIADSTGKIVSGGEATEKGIVAGTSHTWTLSGTVEGAQYSIVLNPSSAGLMHISALELFYE